MDLLATVLGVIVGISLAAEVSYGIVGWATWLVSSLFVVSILIGYPYIVFNGMICSHAFVGKLLFYATFIIGYYSAISLILRGVNHVRDRNKAS